MKLTLSQVEQANEVARRIAEVLKGCKSGSMDVDSLGTRRPNRSVRSIRRT